jgi:hypothetical protein
MPKKVKHKSTKALKKKAWELQSEYVRRYEKGVCYTCGNKRSWKEQQAGHYIHKDCLDFDSMNIHCQCVRCNKWLSGNSGAYAERLIAEYGAEAVAELREKSRRIKKFTVEDLEAFIIINKARLNVLEDIGEL